MSYVQTKTTSKLKNNFVIISYHIWGSSSVDNIPHWVILNAAAYTVYTYISERAVLDPLS